MDGERPAWAIVAAALAEGRSLPTVRALAHEAGVRTAVAAAILKRVRGEAPAGADEEKGADRSHRQELAGDERAEVPQTVEEHSGQSADRACDTPTLLAEDGGGPFHRAWPPEEDRRAAQAVAWRVLWRRAPLAVAAVASGWALVHWGPALLPGHPLLAWVRLHRGPR